MKHDVIPVSVSDPSRRAWLELNDLGNAERLAELARGRLLHVREWGWIAFDDTRWAAENGERDARALAQEVSRAIRDEVRALREIQEAGTARTVFGEWCSDDLLDDRIQKLAAWQVQSGNANRTVAMLAQAQSLLSARREDFDADLWALNCRNGTVRFSRDGGGTVVWRLDPHDPADRFTRIIACDYVPGAQAPVLRAHLEKCLPIVAVRDFYQECVGYGFTGSQREQLFFLLQGRGGDGKSTAQNAIRDMAEGYGQTADVKCFLQGPERSGAEASPDLFRMQGDTRFISCGEPKVGQALDESRIKAMTGGGKLAARAIQGKDIVEFEPRGKVFMECNRKPRVSGDDDGIWRRIMVIPWPYQIKPEERDLSISDKLAAEREGILIWVLEGIARWIERGRLQPPQESLAAVEDYRSAANPFGEWFAGHVDTSDPAAVIESSELFKHYKDWCTEHSVEDRFVLSSTKFGVLLGDRQLYKFKGGNGRVMRRGGKLKAHAPLLAGQAQEAAASGADAVDDDDLWVPDF